MVASLSHMYAPFFVAVTLIAGEVVNLGTKIRPYDDIAGAMSLCLGLGLKLTRACWRRSRGRGGWGSRRGRWRGRA
jgi:hypothetical protein